MKDTNTSESDEKIAAFREGVGPFNGFRVEWTLDNLPISDETKRLVLEWFARKIWRALIDFNVQDGYCKSYDPLAIDGNKAHSYVFDLGDGGRHHIFKDLPELEERLYQELLTQLRDFWKEEHGKDV